MGTEHNCAQCGTPLPSEGREGPCPNGLLRTSHGNAPKAARYPSSSYYLRSSAYRGRAPRIWRWPFRDPLAASLALCLGLLLALTFALLWQWSETERTDAQQRRQQQVLQQNLHRFRRWEARIWRLVKRPADGRVQSATFSPDGKMITINGRVWVLTIPAAPTPAVEGTNTTVDHH